MCFIDVGYFRIVSVIYFKRYCFSFFFPLYFLEHVTIWLRSYSHSFVTLKHGLSLLLKILFHLILLFLVPLFLLSLLKKLFSFSLSDIRKQSTSSSWPFGLYAKIQYLLLCRWISLRNYTYKNLGFVVNFIPFHWTEA